MFNRLRQNVARVIAPRPKTTQGEIDRWGKTYSGGGHYRQLVSRLADLRPDDEGLALAVEASVWAGAAVDLRVRNVAGMPWRIVNTASGNEVTNHAFHRALAYAYAEFDQHLFAQWVMAMVVHGENYFEKLYIPYTNFEPGGLRWLNPLATEPVIMGDRIDYFEYTSTGGQYLRLPPDDVLMHRRINLLDDLRGTSPLGRALDAVNIDREMQRVVKAFFVNDATPGGILTGRRGVLLSREDEERIIAQWQEQLEGAENAFRVMLLPHALEYQQVQQANFDGQEQLDDRQKTRICTALGVPLSMVNAGGVSDPLSAGGTAESNKALFFENTVKPDCTDMALFINEKIMPWLDRGRRGLYLFEWDFSKIDSLVKYTRQRTDKALAEWQAGAITRNQLRERIGEQPLPGGDHLLLAPGSAILIDINELERAPELSAPPAPAFPLLSAPPGALDGQAGADTVALGAGQDEEVSAAPPAKAEDGICVLLQIGADASLVSLQRRLREMYAGQPVEWNEPDSLHVTLLYAPTSTRQQRDRLAALLAEIDVPELSLRVGSLRSFDNLGNYALHFRIRRNADLLELQEEVYSLAEALGLSFSAYHEPAGFTPHITMGYSETKLPTVVYQGNVSVKPRSLVLSMDGDERDDDEYVTLYERPLGAVITLPDETPDEPPDESPDESPDEPPDETPEANPEDEDEARQKSAGATAVVPVTVTDAPSAPQQDALDELRAWRRVAFNKRLGDKKRRVKGVEFQAYHLPERVTSVVKWGLALGCESKAVFDTAAAILVNIWQPDEDTPPVKSHDPAIFRCACTDCATKAESGAAQVDELLDKLEAAIAEDEAVTGSDALELLRDSIRPDALEYWAHFDDLRREIVEGWLAGYMQLAFNRIEGQITESIDEEFDVLAVLAGLHEELEGQWLGTADDTGPLVQIVLAGLAAGTTAITNSIEPAPTGKALKQLTGTIRWDQMSQEAYDFARQYLPTLIRRIDETTQQQVRQTIAQWIQSGKPLTALSSSLQTIFADEKRAEMIAQTESSRVFHAGSEARYASVGVTRAKFRTVRDNAVCPICRPLDGTEADLDVGWPVAKGNSKPPVHPRCRCYEVPVLPAEPAIGWEFIAA